MFAICQRVSRLVKSVGLVNVDSKQELCGRLTQWHSGFYPMKIAGDGIPLSIRSALVFPL